MTAPRRQQKAWQRLPSFGVAILATAAAIGFARPDMLAATERVVVDDVTGIALSGYDPVAYFTDRTPRLGKTRYEYAYKGAVWLFDNQGNREAFVRHPDVYMPRFGGYDPIALMRSVTVPGHPRIWLIAGQRLYLFSRPEHRADFAADVARMRSAAERGWRAVEPTLVR